MKFKALLTHAALASVALSATLASAQTQGVTKNEIVLGSIQDLSGPIAGFGKQVRNGMQLAVEELNEQGGINGRKIKLIVEDHAYDPKKAVLAAPPHAYSPALPAARPFTGSMVTLTPRPNPTPSNVPSLNSGRPNAVRSALFGR